MVVVSLRPRPCWVKPEYFFSCLSDGYVSKVIIQSSAQSKTGYHSVQYNTVLRTKLVRCTTRRLQQVPKWLKDATAGLYYCSGLVRYMKKTPTFALSAVAKRLSQSFPSRVLYSSSSSSSGDDNGTVTKNKTKQKTPDYF